MARQLADLSDDQRHEMMEVHGFDLLAQVEAMLRHVRQYQREVQRLRGTLGKGQTTTSKRTPLDAVQEHVKRLQSASGTFAETVEALRELTGPAEVSRRRAGRKSASNARRA
jgi:hypothetical protein